MDFVYESNDENNMTEKFRVFIKNIATDGRSKIDSYCFDTKKRLFFFNEVHESIINDNYQLV